MLGKLMNFKQLNTSMVNEDEETPLTCTVKVVASIGDEVDTVT